MSEILKLRNLGPKSVEWLNAIGVKTRADLEKIGSIEAYKRVAAAGFKPSLNLLYAMEGALQDRHWSSFSMEERLNLDLQINHPPKKK